MPTKFARHSPSRLCALPHLAVTLSARRGLTPGPSAFLLAGAGDVRQAAQPVQAGRNGPASHHGRGVAFVASLDAIDAKARPSDANDRARLAAIST